MRRSTGRLAAVFGAAVLVAAVAGPAAATPTPRTSTPAPVCDSVDDGGDAGHTGFSCTSLGSEAPAQRWSVELHGTLDYPVIVGGDVYVIAKGDAQHAAELDALDGRTGALLWADPLESSYDDHSLAYANGVLATIDDNGVMSGYSVTDGRQLWVDRTGGGTEDEATGYGDAFYLQDNSYAFAVDAVTGTVRWTSSSGLDGTASELAVDDARVYAVGGCSQTALSRTTGVVEWHDDPQRCFGGGTGTAHLAGDQVWTDGAFTDPAVLDTASGAVLGSFSGAPAFTATDAVLADGNALRVESLATLATLRTTTLPGQSATSPVLVGGVAYVGIETGSGAGQVAGVEIDSGALVFRAALPSVPSSATPDATTAGIAAGDGLLVVPSTDHLTAFGAGAAAASSRLTRRAGFVASAGAVVPPVRVVGPPRRSPPIHNTAYLRCDDDQANEDAARDGVTCGGPGIDPSRRWSAPTTLGEGYPVIAGGRVFVTSGTPDGSYGGELTAYSAATGAILWGPVSLSGAYASFPAAYGDGTLVVSSFDGAIRGFDPSNGVLRWTANTGAFTGVPTVLGDTAYVQGASAVTAIDIGTGDVLWTSQQLDGEDGTPAADSSGVYVSSGCRTFRLAPTTGAVQWTGSDGCGFSGVSGQAYLDDGVVYSSVDFSVRSAATGAQVGTYVGTPVFDGHTALLVDRSTVYLEDPTTRAPVGEISLPAGVATSPVLADGMVWFEGTDGRAYGVSVSGGPTWSAALPTYKTSEISTYRDIAVGDGVFVAPSGDVESVFGRP